MSAVRWSHAGVGGRQTPVRVENLALVPASLLPHKATYQRLANQLPAGAVLVVLHTEDTAEKQTLQTAAARLLAKGHPVTTLSVDELLDLIPHRCRPQPAVAAASPTLPVPSADAAPPPILAAPPVLEVPAVPPFTRELRLVSIDASRNRARFYVLQWQRTCGARSCSCASGGGWADRDACRSCARPRHPR